ncbi:hypothetical protein C8Q80DRAFT_379772 [Daedaleopsis nitida]|nr:hypothetical protein C8Q80DRAFT_379772 [Daedaleopsis nitida]
MTELANRYSPWPCNRMDKSLPLPPMSVPSNPTSPIPIPRRKPIRPPPCSPTRDQDSPELVFNFDFSISPDGPDLTSQIMLQQRGVGTRRFPLQQKATHTPLAALGVNCDPQTHPYAQEPFLYAVPKVPARHTLNTHVPRYADQNVSPDPVHAPDAHAIETLRSSNAPSVASSASSESSYSSSGPSVPPSADVSMQLDDDEDFPLTSAFRRPLVSASVTSSSISSLASASFAPSIPYRSPSPSPPRQFYSRARMPNIAPPRPTALLRTTTAAPVVSLNVAQAQRMNHGRRYGRSPSPYPGVVQPRTRRSSSAGAEHDNEKYQDPGRRMATVVGRGAGRVVSMFEYSYGGGRSLVSDEDIERSLEKGAARDASGEDSVSSESPRMVEERRKEMDNRLPGSPEIERGRPRGRAAARGGATATRPRALPGWQWLDAQ